MLRYAMYRGEQEVDKDKTKQIKLINGTRMVKNLTFRHVGTRGFISCGQRRPGDEARSKLLELNVLT